MDSNIVKNLERARSSLSGGEIPEAWKLVDGEKRNTLGDAFIIKNSEERKEGGLTSFLKREIREEVHYLKIYYFIKGSRQERSYVGWFRPVLETLFGRK